MVINARNFVTSDDGLGGAVIERSLRYGRVSNTYLARTNGSAGNQKTWTYSFWMKRTRTGNINLLNEGNTNALPWTFLYIENEKFHFWNITSGGVGGVNYWYDVIRDLNAWYHIVLRVDTTQSTAANRVRLYINGTEATIQQDNRSSISQNVDTQINGTDEVRIGNNVPTNQSLEGYLADVYIIDGQSLDPSYFGYTESQTGIWRPKRYTGTYGTNGFHLEFNDNSGTTATTLGKDTSGNGNNWTPNNFATNDSSIDTPANLFCTFNELSNYDNNTLSGGGLKVTGTGSAHNWQQVRGNMGVNTGKWYFEIRCNSISATEGWIAGIHEIFARDTDGYWWYNGSYSAANFGYAYGVQDNNQRRTNQGSDDAFSSDVTAGKVVGIRMNLDDNEILISVDGVDKGKMYDIQSGITYAPAVNIYTSSSATLNCGQDSTFGGEESAGGNSDSNGIGDFAYAVPSGYLALCSKNLPVQNVPSIIRPQKHFDCITYTGNNSSRSITGLEFQPDVVWAKNRTGSNSNVFYDSVRGATKELLPNTTGVEQTESTGLTSFDSNGFSCGNNGGINGNGGSYVAWCWKAGGSSVSNTDGTITAQVSANQEAGFSVMTWTGTGYVSGKTIGHGLGKAPKMIWAKRRNISTDNWAIYFNDGTTKVSWFFNTSAAINPAQSEYWPANDPTSSVFYIGTDSAVNGSASMEYVGYAWAEIPGYSKIGRYVGNGASRGTFIFLGFRPAWIMIRSLNSANWNIFDTTRDEYNVTQKRLRANSSDTEVSQAATYIDILSNGFQMRNTDAEFNTNNVSYIYMAFADEPGTTSFDTFPNAR